jgi:hypothetical protein
MANNAVVTEIKSLGWSAIQLNKKGYRGAVQVYRGIKGEKVPVMFYIDECFVVEDNQGLFRVEDLKDFFMKKSSNVDLEATGLIEGLSLIAYKDESSGKVCYMDSVMTRLNINTKLNREDISRRLNAVYQLGEMEDVDLGF